MWYDTGDYLASRRFGAIWSEMVSDEKVHPADDRDDETVRELDDEVRTAPRNDDSSLPDVQAQADATADADDDDSGSEPRRVSPWLIAVSVILLVAIGVGLGALIPRPAPAAPTAAAIPTVPAPLTDPSAQPEPNLPAAIGDYTSTEPIARVGDATITRGDFVRLYQPGVDPTQLLDQLVMRELVVQAAADEGVEVDQEAITAYIEQIKATQAGGDDALFASFLVDNQIGTEDRLRDLLGRDQLIEQMVLRHTEAEHVLARHILLSGDTPEAIAARRGEAEELLQQIEDGGDFAALAAEFSDDPGSGANGGDLGWAPRGIFVPPFDEAVFSMEVGELRLVESQFGWHIIEVLEAPEVRSFESMDLLNTQAGQAAFETTFMPWADSLRADAEAAGDIEILVTAEELVSQPAGT